MKLVLPPGVSAATFDRALKKFAAVVGNDGVFATDEDRDTYLDPYAAGDAEAYGASAGVAPRSTEQVQAIVRVANEERIPLWPISRGKNLGYGGSAPFVAGSVVVDLTRMNRIIEVNEEFGYIAVEPGVSFIDLYEHLTKTKSGLWMSAPAHLWGSIVGNTMERGYGYTPYGDHAAKMCGMEVVLPTGEVVRTGMGAMDKSTSWHLFKNGFGPSWDGMFQQSNFGIVTRMGMWMMPAPEQTVNLAITMPNETDLGPAIDALRPLKLSGIVQGAPSVANIIRNLALRVGSREEIYDGPGPIPRTVVEAAGKKYGVGWWNFSIRLFGDPEINAIQLRKVKAAFAKTNAQMRETAWNRGEPLGGSGHPVPTMGALSIVNWRGGRGGHMDFSPVSPPTGAHATKQYEMTRKRYEEYGFDYYGGFTAGDRHLNHITMIIYDRDDEQMTAKGRDLFKVLVADAAAEGYGEYRTHVRYQDLVGSSYNWNNNALQRLNQKVKDALDPNGILAPGKSGIWPKGVKT